MQQMNDNIAALGRILLSIIYVWAGFAKLVGFAAAVKYIESQGFPIVPPLVQTIIIVILEFGGGLLVLLGLWTRLGAILLLIHTVLAMFVVHHFWTMEAAARYGNAINFYKNLGLVGGLLLLYVTGPGGFSLDRMMAKKSTA